MCFLTTQGTGDSDTRKESSGNLQCFPLLLDWTEEENIRIQFLWSHTCKQMNFTKNISTYSGTFLKRFYALKSQRPNFLEQCIES